MKVKHVKILDKGARALLNSPEVMSVLRSHGSRTLGRLGDGYQMMESNNPARGRVTVGTQTIAARIENQRYNTLKRALEG